jgi:GNAT superfamily N-acetyltransferase
MLAESSITAARTGPRPGKALPAASRDDGGGAVNLCRIGFFLGATIDMKPVVRDFFESVQGYATGKPAVYSFVEGVEVGLRPSRKGDSVYVLKIRSRPDVRGQGLASETLKAICTKADQHGVDLFLEVEESDGLSSADLSDWYWRYGFRGNLQEMVRRYACED